MDKTEKYYCNACKYFTDDQSNMNKHKKSNKHMTIVHKKNLNNDKIIKKVKILNCIYCDKIFVNNSAKWKHEQKCNTYNNASINNANNMNNMNNMNNINNMTTNNGSMNDGSMNDGHFKDVIDLIVKNKDNEIAEYRNLIKELVSCNKNVTEASNKTADVATKSMSILKYATVNMNDAPPLTEINKKEAISILGYRGEDENLSNEQQEYENEMYVQSVIAHYINKNLVNFLSVMIAAYFRKPEDDIKKMSSVWAVDVARLSFIIMSTISKDGEKEWRSDKTGKLFTSMVIKPMLSALDGILKAYIKYKEKMHTKKNLTIDDMNKIMTLRQGCVDLAKDIRYQRLEKPLLKTVAPSFQFDDYLKK
jgi:hypothetical protein